MDREPSPFRGGDEDNVWDETSVHDLVALGPTVLHDLAGHFESESVDDLHDLAGHFESESVDDLVTLGPTVLHDLAGHFESESDYDELDLASESESDDMDVDHDALVDAAIASVHSEANIPAGHLQQQQHHDAPHQNAQANAPPPRGGVFRQAG